MSDQLRSTYFVGPSQQEIRDMPDYARAEIGYGLFLLQQGRDPLSWAPVKTVGTSVREIRIKRGTDIHRCLYLLAGTPTAVYVLLAFTKKDQQIPHRILTLARTRYRDVQAVLKGQRP
ncbi:type II toxin-antitoxin system RelE/ParE family toxin [Gordonia phosphorivorans]|uniref:Type II toxin-antitoxin system RelE/ParE family toxin n=1 Tax=Gordonia phosphorivorans TaxID=1056982 RepID=A0ABV6H454_9ACTN